MHLEMLSSRILQNYQLENLSVFKAQTIKKDIPRININESEENS